MAKSTNQKRSINAATYEQIVAFDAKKALPKKDVLKFKRGALLEIKWRDSHNTFGVLIDKPEKCKGDVSLNLWFPADRSVGAKGSANTYAVHSQVVAMHGYVELRRCDTGPMINLFNPV